MRMSFGAHIPFVEALGFELTQFGDGQAAITFRPRPEHLNSFGVVHGGAVMTLLDVAMAQAARSVQPELGMLTIEMKTSFMRGVPGDGAALSAQARLLHRTSRLAFTEASVYDAQGQLCAHATGTFRYAPRPSPSAPLPTD